MLGDGLTVATFESSNTQAEADKFSTQSCIKNGLKAIVVVVVSFSFPCGMETPDSELFLQEGSCRPPLHSCASVARVSGADGMARLYQVSKA